MNHIKTICVCGAGTMGSGIAQVAALSGYTTIQFDVNSEMLTKSKNGIEKNLHWLLNKGKITTEQRDQCMQRLLFTDQLSDCKADFIIEAIIEKKAVKAALFNQLSTINSGTTIFATNTSSIAITDLAASVTGPQQVVGMHFFNPAPVMKLVEIIKTTQTDEVTIRSIMQLANNMGKTAVVCKDSPGFIVNRVARHYYLEAMKLVEEELASIETIDTIMESSGFKMGPFKLMDLIGMDINYGVSQIVWEALGKPERLAPSPIQKEKVEAGNLGRKTGKGFYLYNR